MTREEVIRTVYAGGHHVVILGAGASIAATIRNPEKSGKKLPSMDNFVDVVGLQDIVPPRLQKLNFETLYSQLHAQDPSSAEIREIERRVYTYFRDMALPDEPTIYDYLVLSLRPKDLIATFNWDPFLYQAYIRNSKVAPSPSLAFLHGSVALGYNKDKKRSGPIGYSMDPAGLYPFEPTRILYPVTNKNYNKHECIRGQWERLECWLHLPETNRVTIFGYSAPVSDLEAVQLMQSAWGTSDHRNMEQFEVLDICPEEQVRQTWDSFIHSHHYDYGTNFFQSSLARNPRRTCESWRHHYMPLTPREAFAASNPVPNGFGSLQEMWDWYGPLAEAEGDIDTA